MPPPLVDPGPPEFRRHGNWGRRKWLHLDPKPRTSILLDTLRESPYLEGDRLESSDGPIAFMREGFPVPLIGAGGRCREVPSLSLTLREART